MSETKKENNNYLKLMDNIVNLKNKHKMVSLDDIVQRNSNNTSIKKGKDNEEISEEEEEDPIILPSDSEAETSDEDETEVIPQNSSLMEAPKVSRGEKENSKTVSLVDQIGLSKKEAMKNDLRHYFKNIKSQGSGKVPADRDLESRMDGSKTPGRVHPIFNRNNKSSVTAQNNASVSIPSELLRNIAACGTSITLHPAPTTAAAPSHAVSSSRDTLAISASRDTLAISASRDTLAISASRDTLAISTLRETIAVPTPKEALGVTLVPKEAVAVSTPRDSSSLLPSLKDDMTVLEAPSFVVPYVYEQPPRLQLRQVLCQLLATSAADNEEDENSTEEEQEQKEPKEIEAKQNKNSISKNYFDNPLGKFFTDIGSNLVQEFVQTDLLRQQRNLLRREKRSGGRNREKLQASVDALTSNVRDTAAVNAPLKLNFKVCHLCEFKSESTLVMQHHLETPHLRGGLLRCSFCVYEVRAPMEMMVHNMTVHGSSVRPLRPPTPITNQCSTCSYQTRNKRSLEKHLVYCEKNFNATNNQKPDAGWEPPAKIMKGKDSRFANMSLRGNDMLSMGTLRQPPAAPVPVPAMVPTSASPAARPQVTITQSGAANNKFVICEVCDGYIRDVEQLRQHLLIVHRLQLHHKVLAGRAPLNCQKCRLRFYTDQGLERHLLGAHALVSAGLQSAAAAGRDAGRCPVCGKVVNKGLLTHVAETHGAALRPAQLSYKCTLCSGTFPAYSLFEKHVYSVHITSLAKNKSSKNRTPK